MAQYEVLEKEREEDEINLTELFHELRQRIGMLLIVTVLGAVLFGCVAKLFLQPKYSARSTVYMFDQTASITTLSDLQMGTQLASDFTILATSEPVVNKMIKDLRLDVEYEDVIGKIKATNASNTRLIELTIEDPDPELATKMANSLADALVDRVKEIMESRQAYVAVPATVPRAPSSPNVKLITLVGAFLGLAVSAGIVIIRFLQDDTIKTAEDVEKYLSLVTLAELPLEYTGKVSKKKKIMRQRNAYKRKQNKKHF